MTTSSDANAAAVSEIIDFSSSRSATRNRVLLYPKRTVGSNPITIDIYAYFDGTVAAWVKIATQSALATGVPVTIDNLPGRQLKMVCTITASETWELHIATTDTYGHP